MTLLCAIFILSCAVLLTAGQPAFPHTVKPDQLAALRKVLSDMSNGTLVTEGDRCPDNSVIHHYSCTPEGDVSVIDLSNRDVNYLGFIPSEIGLLSKLTFIDARFNLLTGSLPAELGRCTDLNTLLLYKNYFRGMVPTELLDLKRLSVCALMSINTPTNCFYCPLPAGLDCGSTLACSAECPDVPQFAQLPAPVTTLPATQPRAQTTTKPTTVRTTTQVVMASAAGSSSSSTTTGVTSTTSTTVAAATTVETAAGNTTVFVPESRVFTHVHGTTATTNRTAASTSLMQLFMVSETQGDHMTAVVIMACILVLVVPLALFFGYSYWRNRRDQLQTLNSLPGYSTVVKESDGYGSLPPPFVNPTASLHDLPDSISNGSSAVNNLAIHDEYLSGGAALAAGAAMTKMPIYDSVFMPLATETSMRMPVNEDRNQTNYSLAPVPAHPPSSERSSKRD